MYPLINGKSFLDCTEDDLSIIISNPDYRENEFIDYKDNFSFLAMNKDDPRRVKSQAEFRSDVCSFANALGGFLVYGLSEDQGMAQKVTGININDGNTDHFELERRNNLNCIQPKMPPVKFGFIRLSSGKYVVVIFVQHDSFAPYIHRENEIDYRIAKRIGNGKHSMDYPEIKQMFNQSISLEESMFDYRKRRVNYYREQEDTSDLRYSRFAMIHIIPETFRDTLNNMNMYLLFRKGCVNFGQMYSEFGCETHAVPNSDGMRYVGYKGIGEFTICNNCISEIYYPLQERVVYYNSHLKCDIFATTRFWDLIKSAVRNYTCVMKSIVPTRRIYLGISVIGCKSVVTEQGNSQNYRGYIDRDIVICNQVLFSNIMDDEDIDNSMKLLRLEYSLSIGMKYEDELDKLIKEIPS